MCYLPCKYVMFEILFLYFLLPIAKFIKRNILVSMSDFKEVSWLWDKEKRNLKTRLPKLIWFHCHDLAFVIISH